MRISLCLDPGRTWPQLLALAQRAEAAGWHAVYVCDHFMPHDPAGQPLDGPMLECWTILTALAARTTTIRLGSLVLGNTYRHPAVVANMAATLDLVSDGRLVLGIGSAWQRNEHAAYGIPLPPPRPRTAALDEASAVIRSLLAQRRTTIEGTAYQVRDAPCDPKPVAGIPLLIGGGGLGTMRVAARHADIWHAWADPAEFGRKNAVLDGLCRDVGRDPGDVARACGGTVTVQASAGREPAPGENDVQGTPEQITSWLLAYRDAGAGEFIVSDDAALVPADQALAQIGVLTKAVLPALDIA